MKKIFSILIIIVCVSCGPAKLLDPVSSNNCENATERYLKAIDTWSTDIESKSKCEAVKKSLNDVIKSCSLYTNAQRKVYEDQLKDFNCDN
ncbi:hypothetical protein EGI22_22940 [Lacihabitans sp. LS3-19]|uniref:hypothetical protein n=1 Tax=Lacihabitans sp. LS3-19 TaxID=2487335 RepID=UPI0020CD685E|nr:hypothetical protein [Lacihabitans sp. LS3-19]MCP9770771.1 hypothetical protein [Lacihabitans sp. LS3-19]